MLSSNFSLSQATETSKLNSFSILLIRAKRIRRNAHPGPIPILGSGDQKKSTIRRRCPVMIDGWRKFLPTPPLRFVVSKIKGGESRDRKRLRNRSNMHALYPMGGRKPTTDRKKLTCRKMTFNERTQQSAAKNSTWSLTWGYEKYPALVIGAFLVGAPAEKRRRGRHCRYDLWL
jgi:hypothetical protein